MYEDQQNERRNKEFQKNKDKHKRNKTQEHNSEDAMLGPGS